jgi:hypothetical protein
MVKKNQENGGKMWEPWKGNGGDFCWEFFTRMVIKLTMMGCKNSLWVCPLQTKHDQNKWDMGKETHQTHQTLIIEHDFLRWSTIIFTWKPSPESWVRKPRKLRLIHDCQWFADAKIGSIYLNYTNLE